MSFALSLQRNCLRHVLYCPCQPQAEVLTAFVPERMTPILNYYHNVFVFEQGGKRYYLKACEEHLPKTAYIARCIADFGAYICANERLQTLLTTTYANPKNQNSLWHMGQKNERGSRLWRYLATGDAKIFGVRDLPNDLAADFKRFVFYVYGECNDYAQNLGLAYGMRQTYGAVRALSTQALAKLLGVERLLPPCRFVTFTYQGKTWTGVLSEQADGVSVADVPFADRKTKITPKLWRDFSDLEVLDALSGETDHRPNNYFIKVDDKGDFVGVCSYDNDGPDAFTPRLLPHHTTGCTPMVVHGKLMRSYLSQTTANKILALTDDDLQVFASLLTPIQLTYLSQRIRRLQGALARATTTLLSDDEWKTADFAAELTNPKTKTYLQSLLKDCYYADGQHPWDRC